MPREQQNQTAQADQSEMKKPIIPLLAVFLLSACMNPGETDRDSLAESTGYDYVQLDSYDNFSTLMLGDMDDFVELMEKYDVEVIYVREYTTVIGVETTEFAFPHEGTLIAVKGRGYRRIDDYIDARSKDILNAADYYDRKSRGFPYIRNFSYFIN